MKHPYFREYHDPNDEPSSDPIDINIEGDNQFTIDHWRHLIWKEITELKSEHSTFNNKFNLKNETKQNNKNNSLKMDEKSDNSV